MLSKFRRQSVFIRSSELLLSIPLQKRNVSQSSSPTSTFSTSTPARTRSPRPSLSFPDQSPAPTQVSLHPSIPITPARHPHAPQVKPQPEDLHGLEMNLETQDEDHLATARACFEAREFLRAVHLLRDCNSSKARFLSIYSQFMVRHSSISRCVFLILIIG